MNKNIQHIEEMIQLGEEVQQLEEKNCPTNPSKWSYYKSQAKQKFDVYPSAYANGWASKQYKAAGGGWKKCAGESVNENEEDTYTVMTRLDIEKAKGLSFSKAKEMVRKNKGWRIVKESVNEGPIDRIIGGRPYEYIGDGRKGKAVVSGPMKDNQKADIIKRAKKAGYTAKPNMGGGVTIFIESVNENKVDKLRNAVQKINRKYQVKVSTHPVTKGEIEIILGRGNHPDSVYHSIEKLVSKLGFKRGQYSIFDESVNEAQKVNPTSKKFLKGMKKIKVNGLGGYMPGVDYVYVDGDKYYFVDFEGDHTELKNTNTIKQLHKLHGKSLGESLKEAYVIFYAKKKGDKPSQAAYRDKDMAVKFEKDLKKDGYITMMVNKKIKGVDESVNEESELAYLLRRMADVGGAEADEFLSNNKVSLYKIKLALRNNDFTKYDLRDVIQGKAARSIKKKVMRHIKESVNEASVGDFEIGDFVHFKSKNKTGMVLSIKGNKVTINTPKGKVTGDIKDVQVLYQDNVNNSVKEDENDPQEIKVGNYQTKYFHVCPGASTLYKDIESKGVDMDMAERSVRLQDALFFIEEHIQRDGYDPEKDYVMVAKNIAKNIMKLAKMMGLEEEHNYIQGHIDTIEKVVNGGSVNEGNAFTGALFKARKEGLTEFEFNGKKYPVHKLEEEDVIEEGLKSRRNVVREGVMSNIDMLAGESDTFMDFMKTFKKEYPEFDYKNKDLVKWLQSTYKSKRG